MKKQAIMCLLWFSLAGIGSPLLSFPNGSYLGMGNWRSDNYTSGTYVKHIKFSSNNISFDYEFNNNINSVELSLDFDDHGNFEVSHNGNVVGNGFCMSIQCRYSIVVNDVSISEVLTFMNGHLYKLGLEVDSIGATRYLEENAGFYVPAAH